MKLQRWIIVERTGSIVLKRLTLRHMDAGRKVVTETEYSRLRPGRC